MHNCKKLEMRRFKGFPAHHLKEFGESGEISEGQRQEAKTDMILLHRFSNTKPQSVNSLLLQCYM